MFGFPQHLRCRAKALIDLVFPIESQPNPSGTALSVGLFFKISCSTRLDAKSADYSMRLKKLADISAPGINISQLIRTVVQIGDDFHLTSVKPAKTAVSVVFSKLVHGKIHGEQHGSVNDGEGCDYGEPHRYHSSKKVTWLILSYFIRSSASAWALVSIRMLAPCVSSARYAAASSSSIA